MTVIMPEPVQMRKAPTYDYDTAIKRRFGDIQALGDSANQYSQQLAQRRAQAKIAAQQAAIAKSQQLAQQARTQTDSTAGFGTGLSGGKRSQIVKYASTLKGTPYVWGGESFKEGGFDCSGLVQYVYGKMGVKMPRVSQQQATMGKVTNIQSLKQGDFVAWGSSPATATHIAIYAGNGMVWEAPHKGATVRLRRISPNERGIMGIALSI
jgi:cell wall-associated NlpC family hydrolase